MKILPCLQSFDTALNSLQFHQQVESFQSKKKKNLIHVDRKWKETQIISLLQSDVGFISGVTTEFPTSAFQTLFRTLFCFHEQCFSGYVCVL